VLVILLIAALVGVFAYKKYKAKQQDETVYIDDDII